MRRWLGDALRSAANLVDKPKPIVIQPLIVRIDGRQLADAVLKQAFNRPRPRHVSALEWIIGHIFGWL